MKLIRGLHNFKKPLAASVVTLGNFDGVHLGHQALVDRIKKLAADLNAPTMVILFEPQPREFFKAEPSVPRLMRFREKYLALKAAGIDYCLCLYFNKKLAALSAEKFVQKILIDKCNAKAIVVGDDFQFGAKRAGDINLLQQYNFAVEAVAPISVANRRVSSTRVRNALITGQIEYAARYLGHPYILIGKVAHGEKRGRELGFPTANIFLHRKQVPLSGIYAVRVHGIDNKIYFGSAYIGTRPVFNGTRVIMEVHVLDFSGDLYGKNIQVEVLHKIRGDANFDSVEALVKQINLDIAQTREFVKNNPAYLILP